MNYRGFLLVNHLIHMLQYLALEWLPPPPPFDIRALGPKATVLTSRCA